MKNLILLLCVFLFSNCQNESPTTNVQLQKTVINNVPSFKSIDKQEENNELPINIQEQESFLSLIIDFKTIIYKGVNSYASKSELITKLGEPNSIKEPKYECGFYSEEEQGSKFYQYFYDNMNFISDGEVAVIENIIFDNNMVIEINEVSISQQKSIQEIADDFGILLGNESLENGDFTFIDKTTDEQYSLIYENEKVIKLELWSPC